jgi:hypothetical protein
VARLTDMPMNWTRGWRKQVARELIGKKLFTTTHFAADELCSSNRSTVHHRAALAAALACACGGGLTSVGPDGSMFDASVDVGAIDASEPDETPPDVADAAPLYNDFNDPASWQVGATYGDPTFDDSPGFGGAFDGRYVYELRETPGQQVGTMDPLFGRYDTTQSFDKASSWTFDGVGGLGVPFLGLVWANSRLYAIPKAGHSDLVAIDPSQPTWPLSLYRLAPNLYSAQFERMVGGVYDGQYLYFFDWENHVIQRYDTTKSLKNPASYEAMVGFNCEGNWIGGGIFDGRRVYFQAQNEMYSTDYNIVSFDTTQPAKNYSSYDTVLAHGHIVGSRGGMAFDGLHVYALVGDEVWIHDPSVPISVTSSWVAFQISQLKQYDTVGEAHGLTFDGRYLYVGTNPYGTKAFVVRYDTTKVFGDPASWQVFDVGSLTQSGTYWGCGSGLVFDGEYVYCVAGHVRFHARNTPFQPSLPSSFY